MNERTTSRFNLDHNAAQYPRAEPVHRLFEQQVERTPRAVAVTCGQVNLTYAALAERANRLSCRLRRWGIGPGSKVGILLDPTADVPVAMLGILKAGAAYVPLDPAHPHARTRFIVGDAGLSVLLTEPSISQGLGEIPARVAFLPELLLDPAETEPLPTVPSPEDPAYIIYTSGTTGDPKGVVIPHRALTSYAWCAKELYAGAGAATFPLYSSLAFDLTVTSLFVPLLAGGRIIVYPGASPIASLMAAVHDERIDTLKLTPSHLSLVVSRDNRGSRIRRMIVGGEALSTKLARRALESFGPHLEIFNEYGPTEATVGCIVHPFDPHRDSLDSVPIGRPLPNTRAYVLDPSRAPVPDGTTGELYLAGDCLATGYLGNPAEAQGSFLENPRAPSEILYKTGDLARRLPEGDLEFLGRSDTQIKFAGHRVELAGMRALLQRHPKVRDSVVVLREDESGHGALVAYYTSEMPLAPGVLRSFMTSLVSQDIVPSFFVHVPSLPLTSNGKVDTAALPSLEDVRQTVGSASAPPRTPAEVELAAIWARSLGLSHVGIDDDFFELGGHSLLGNRIILQIRESFGVDLNMRSIFENRTIAALARSIEQARASAAVRLGSDEAQAEPPPDLPALPFDLAMAERSASPGARTARRSDEENLPSAESIAAVDDMVGDFYSRFPWPWNSSKFETLADPDFETVMVSQEVGDYEHRALPREASIWVAGCGTNQALLTALRFPKARVLGTDLSTKSLEICAESAAELGVKNLELKLESINDAPYEGAFDHVVCTGVIHHTYDPAHALSRLSRAMKPDGLLELLVYNRFHRTITSAFQKAIRIMTRGLSANDYAVAKRLAAGFALDNTMARFISRHRDWEESDFADLLINPVEHSYTVDSLAEMAEGCDLELVRPCISLYAKYRAESIFWEMSYSDPDIQRLYDKMPDLDRWRVSNLLMHEKSPMLWFYLQRRDTPRPRKSEQELNAAFLQTRFERAITEQRSYIRGTDGRFRVAPRSIRYPASVPDDSVRAIYERFDRSRVMGEVFAELGIEPSFANVQRARIYLTIPAFPYLRATVG
ncbi:amino acid adenylation domain-containing protein [Polyangium jinanense]|uniref:Amino acid adenylation domain-containing protein n=1 Tax=Polyangium jinanense TaxID=2829994 RepID=A0A9X3X0J2_9BACT|nr:amino acid adenylation domain-containing protein [Polyangium jinanense]MDC3954777.1 amino acid adenylation domain-containing protein [Polyangium jinanense]MDC3981452.1 amino acid adenylation domain-containing protein [Polyangium jinanense]